MVELSLDNVRKSKNFDRNLDSKKAVDQIEKNLYQASEILKDTSNAIAPIDSGKLRSNVTTQFIIKKIKITSRVVWKQPYAGIRYVKNDKNPQTMKWVEKGYKKKRKVLENKMKEGVLK